VQLSLDKKSIVYDLKIGQFQLLAMQLRRPLVLGSLLLLLVPICLPFFFIHRFGTNLPLLDEWYYLMRFQAWQTGHTSLLDLLTVQNNEHRVGVACLVEVFLGCLSHCSSLWQMYGFATCRVFTACLLIDLLNTDRRNWSMACLLGVPIVLHLCSLRQWENLLWGFQLCIGLSCLFFVLMVWLLCKYRSSSIAFGGAILAAFSATFSFANGLLAWPIGFLIVLDRGDKSWTARKLSQCLAWSIAGCLTVLAYFLNFQLTDALLQKSDQHASLLDRLSFVLAGLGNSLGQTKIECLIAGGVTGVLTVGAIVAITKMRSVKSSEPGLALLLYGLGSVFLTVIGRCDPGWERATNSRYSSFTDFVLVGIYMTLVMPRVNRFWAGLIATIILVGYSAQIWGSMVPAGIMRDYCRNKVQTLINWQLMNRQTRASFIPENPKFDELLSFLRQQKLSLFWQSNSDARLEAATKHPFFDLDIASSDSADRRCLHFKKNSSDRLVFSGWAIDPGKLRPAQSPQIVVDDLYAFPCRAGKLRPDVARIFQNPNLLKCGFEAELIPAEWLPGVHSIRFKTYDFARQTYWLSGRLASLIVD
jgi:hypothetical protein